MDFGFGSDFRNGCLPDGNLVYNYVVTYPQEIRRGPILERETHAS